MYDIIGDIHGYATPLKNLLAKLGYTKVDGVWQHPERTAVFLGDFVDRGPEQIETVQTVRSMVMGGHALSVMGNHELNAIAWVTPDPNEPGSFMRTHNDKNLKQHKAFLDQAGEGSALHLEIIEWFKTLPLYLELDDIRVVHACWHEPSLEALNQTLDESQRIKPDAYINLLRNGTPEYEAGETLLKGLEIELPIGYEFLDKDKHPRRNIRTQWWRSGTQSLTYRDLAIVPPDILEKIPHEPAPDELMPGYASDKLLFVGHYWLTGTPAPLSAHIACLDYSIAAKEQRAAHEKGKLCAYRFNGETQLTQEGFVWVNE